MAENSIWVASAHNTWWWVLQIWFIMLIE